MVSTKRTNLNLIREQLSFCEALYKERRNQCPDNSFCYEHCMKLEHPVSENQDLSYPYFHVLEQGKLLMIWCYRKLVLPMSLSTRSHIHYMTSHGIADRYAFMSRQDSLRLLVFLDRETTNTSGRLTVT